MTPLEIIFAGIIWIGYGVFAGYQTKLDDYTVEDNVWTYFWYILFSPVVFLLKSLYGAFKQYK